MFGYLLRRFGRGMAIEMHLRKNKINKLCLSSDICIFCLLRLRCTWPISAILFCHKTPRFCNLDRTPLLYAATFLSVQFILGQGLTCNFFRPKKKGQKSCCLSRSVNTCKEWTMRWQRARTTHIFTAVLVQSGYARGESRYFDVTAGCHVPYAVF